MASGDIHVVSKFVSNMSKASLASVWAADVVKIALITSATTPNITDSDPRWGAGGAQDYSTNEVSGGDYTAGGKTLNTPANATSGAVTTLSATSPVSWAANAASPTNARWGVIYDSTDAGKRVFGFLDLGGDTSLVNGLNIYWNSVSSGDQPIFTGTAT